MHFSRKLLLRKCWHTTMLNKIKHLSTNVNKFIYLDAITRREGKWPVLAVSFSHLLNKNKSEEARVQ